MVNIGDLLPKASDIKKAKVEGFVHATLARLAKDLGASQDILRQIKNNDERYDVHTFMADFPKFPWKIVVDTVDSYNVQSLFETPTKSPVLKQFREHFPDWQSTPDGQIMFFRASGFSTLVIGTANVFDSCGTYLTVTPRKGGMQIFITTYGEFIDAIRDRGVLEA